MHWNFLGFGAAALALLAGCGDATMSTGAASAGGGEGGPATCAGVQQGSPGPGAFDASFRTSSAFFTQMAGLNLDGTSIHQATQIFYSCNLHGLLDETTLDVPEGTVAIKVQGPKSTGEPASLRVMVKHAKGFDAKHGDFAFEARSLDGELAGNGPPDFCFGCHSGYAETGYLAGTSIKTE